MRVGASRCRVIIVRMCSSDATPPIRKLEPTASLVSSLAAVGGRRRAFTGTIAAAIGLRQQSSRQDEGVQHTPTTKYFFENKCTLCTETTVHQCTISKSRLQQR